MGMDIKAIVFDCFGVLYTDNKVSLLAHVPLEQHNDIKDVFMGSDYGYIGRSEFLRRVAEITGMSEKEIEDITAHEHRINAQLVDVIEQQLKSRYKVGLLSNIGRDRMSDYFSTERLHELFDAYALSGEEGIAKPHPAIFELIAERLGVHPGECLMIDDIAANCEGAEIAGMQSIQYTGNAELLDRLYELKIL